MNFALGVVENHSRDVQVPINVVTSTYLDPRRYKKFLTVWSYLGALGLVQIAQSEYVKYRNVAWKRRLEQWKNQMNGIAPDLKSSYEWIPFKEDFLPQTVDMTLQNFVNDSNSIPLQSMGASFVDHLNIVFDKKTRAHIDPLTVGRNDGDVEYSSTDIAEEVAKSLQQNYESLSTINYKTMDASQLPPWKSRFILAPENIPSDEELRSILGEDYNLQNPLQEFDDEGEKEDEFKQYELEEFLSNLTITDNAENTLRSRFILDDIEQNRRDIVRQAIMSITKPKTSE
jgi:hypothetical protein